MAAREGSTFPLHQAPGRLQPSSIVDGAADDDGVVAVQPAGLPYGQNRGVGALTQQGQRVHGRLTDRLGDRQRGAVPAGGRDQHPHYAPPRHNQLVPPASAPGAARDERTTSPVLVTSGRYRTHEGLWAIGHRDFQPSR